MGRMDKLDPQKFKEEAERLKKKIGDEERFVLPPNTDRDADIGDALRRLKGFRYNSRGYDVDGSEYGDQTQQ